MQALRSRQQVCPYLVSLPDGYALDLCQQHRMCLWVEVGHTGCKASQEGLQVQLLLTSALNSAPLQPRELLDQPAQHSVREHWRQVGDVTRSDL